MNAGHTTLNATDNRTLSGPDARSGGSISSCPGIVVKVDAGEPIESALRRFKKMFARSDISGDIKRHEFFVAPSQRRRDKAANARARRAKIA